MINYFSIWRGSKPKNFPNAKLNIDHNWARKLQIHPVYIQRISAGWDPRMHKETFVKNDWWIILNRILLTFGVFCQKHRIGIFSDSLLFSIIIIIFILTTMFPNISLCIRRPRISSVDGFIIFGPRLGVGYPRLCGAYHPIYHFFWRRTLPFVSFSARLQFITANPWLPMLYLGRKQPLQLTLSVLTSVSFI